MKHSALLRGVLDIYLTAEAPPFPTTPEIFNVRISPLRQAIWLVVLGWALGAVGPRALAQTTHCIGFDDLTLGTVYHSQDSILSALVPGQFEDFRWPDGTGVSDGHATVQTSGASTNQELFLDNITLAYQFDLPLQGFSFEFVDLGGNVNFTINGDSRNLADLGPLGGSLVGNCNVSIGGSSVMGTLMVMGTVHDFAIGGAELRLDQVCLLGFDSAPPRGDVNLDGRLTESDALLALDMAVGLRAPTGPAGTAADVSRDGLVSVLDPTLILRTARGLAPLPNLVEDLPSPIPNVLRVGSVTVPAGGLVEVPVELVDARGDATSLALSLSWNPGLLTLVGLRAVHPVPLPLPPLDASNTNLVQEGKLAFALVGADRLWGTNGTYPILFVSFRVTEGLEPTTTTIELNDSLARGGVVEMPAGTETPLPAPTTYQPGTVTVERHVLAPVITRQPLSQSVNLGDNVTLFFEVTGEELSFQWFMDGAPIPGGTGASYSIANFGEAHAGIYQARVSSLAGTVWTDPARLRPAVHGCFGFEDLPLGTPYAMGTTFETAGFTQRVVPWVGTPPPPPPGSVTVGNQGKAGGSGQELEMHNASVDWSFWRPLTGLTLRVSLAAGTLNVGVNGTHSVNVSGFSALAPTRGVTFAFTPDAGASETGTLTLTGLIYKFILGGELLYVDDVCPAYGPLDEPACLGFEGEGQSSWPIGEQFMSGKAFLEASPLTLLDGTSDPTSVSVKIVPAGSGRSGYEVSLERAALTVTFPQPLPTGLIFTFYPGEGPVNLKVLGVLLKAEKLTDLNGRTVGGYGGVSIQVYEVPGTGKVKVTLLGRLQSFSIGAKIAAVDDICPGTIDVYETHLVVGMLPSVKLTGLPERLFAVQYRDALAGPEDWRTLTTVRLSTTPSVHLVDSDSGTEPGVVVVVKNGIAYLYDPAPKLQRFYRAVAQ